MTVAPPLAPAESFRRLDPRVVAIWRVTTLVRSLVWIVALLGVASLFPIDVPEVLLVVAVGAGAAISIIFVAPARYRAWEFRVGEADVRLRHGVLWRTESVVPHFRIQHVDTTHGPLQRWRGLASVIIYTAGSVGGALTIPGLALADAEALRDHLAALSGTDDAV